MQYFFVLCSSGSVVLVYSLENIGAEHGCQVECSHPVVALLLLHVGEEVAQVTQDAVMNIW